MINEVYNKRILELAANIERLRRLDAPDATATAVSRLCGMRSRQQTPHEQLGALPADLAGALAAVRAEPPGVGQVLSALRDREPPVRLGRCGTDAEIACRLIQGSEGHLPQHRDRQDPRPGDWRPSERQAGGDQHQQSGLHRILP